MATKTYYFSGICEWLKKDDEYRKHSLDLYMDDASWNKFENSGAQLKRREKNGRRFVSFGRPFEKMIKGEVKLLGPPLTINENGDPVELKKIGNGSKVTCKVNVYDTPKGKGTELVAIRVDELVEYNPVQVDETEESPF